MHVHAFGVQSHSGWIPSSRDATISPLHHLYPNTFKSTDLQNIKQGLFRRNLSVTFPEHRSDGLSRHMFVRNETAKR